MDTKKLRQKILDLAIRGKLVPQDPNDEPASVLLERIRAEKEQLIKEGKIKRTKKSNASDTSHYENVPFEVPEGWCWVRVYDISSAIIYGVSESAKSEGKYKLLRITDIQNNKVNWNTVPLTDYPEEKAASYTLRTGDILFARTGATVGKSYLVDNSVPENSIYASYLIRVQVSSIINSNYVKYFFESGFYWNQIADNSVGVGQPNVNGTSLGNLWLPIPPIQEQERIVEKLNSWCTIIDEIKVTQESIRTTISDLRSRILEYAISGKLVPQDYSDESAIELLKRINPMFSPADNRHYENIPEGWAICIFEDVLEYEQPQKYIVSSTDYSDKYKVPVLTAGKSFIIGKTNEEFGVCNNLPVIIFDDFTTDSKYVDFPFKVKSSAMKILHPKVGISPRYIAYLMSVTRLVGDTHKRYWISEYSKIPILLPPAREQERIVAVIDNIFDGLDRILADL